MLHHQARILVSCSSLLMARIADVQRSYLGSRLLEVCGIYGEARDGSDTLYHWKAALCTTD